jgi:hypothetical protein
MDELKVLVGMVKDLPAMAIWVIAFFWAYKVIFIGSVYGVIKYIVTKWAEWKMFVPPIPPVQIKEFKFSNISISEEVAMALLAQIARIPESRGYFYMNDVVNLSRAIDQLKNDKE